MTSTPLKESERVAVVTGGARGIGLAIVRRLAEDGLSVVALDQLDEPLRDAVLGLQQQGLKVQGRSCDVTDRSSVARVIGELSAVHVVVAAHGIILVKPFDQITDEEFDRVLRVNLSGTFIVFQESLRRMSSGARMVAISSRGVLGDTQTAAYIASKAALVGLVRAMAFEFRGQNIAVNAIAPGFTDTAMVRENLGEDRFNAAAAREPRGRPADPSEIANAVAFLAAERTTFITGQTIFVDGGKSLGGLAAPV